MVKNPIPNVTTFRNFADHYYYIGKEVCEEIWNQPDFWFEDVFHNTILKCMTTLDGRLMEQDEMKAYWFKAFRINMIRHFGYAFCAKKSGIEFSKILLPSTFTEDELIDRMEGFQMLNFVNNKFGLTWRDILYKNLSGIPVWKLSNEYNITDIPYHLKKIKHELKKFYS